METIETARDFLVVLDALRSLEEAMPDLDAPLDLDLRGTIVVLPWSDPVVEQLGHDPRSPYVEQFYLALLGPTLTFLLRRIADALDAWPDGFEADLEELAGGLGLASTPGGRHGPFGRALGRAVKLGLAQPHPFGLSVRRKLPPLSYRQVAKLPPALQQAHRGWRSDDAA